MSSHAPLSASETALNISDVRRRIEIKPGAHAPRIESLDSMRGIASVVVLINHCLLIFPEFGNLSHLGSPDSFSWFHLLLRNTPLRALYDGSAAVMLFFVLSGIALTLSLTGSRQEIYPAYLARRLCRIYLPYLAAILIAALLSTSLARLRPDGLSDWFQERNWAEPLGWSSVLNYGLMLGQQTTLDNPVWSLDYEIRISLIFPALLWLSLRRPIIGHAAVGGALLVLGLIVADLPTLGWALSGVARYGAAFVLGAAIAYLASWLRAQANNRTIPLSLAAVGLIAICAFRNEYAEMLGASAILVSTILPGPVDHFCRRAALRFLGKISYSLYLIHLPTLLTAIYLFHGSVPLIVLVGVAAIFSLLMAWMFHILVEEPCRKLGGICAVTYFGRNRPVWREREPAAPLNHS